MWMMAVGSAVFAGLTAIPAKCGIRKTGSDVAMALRTIVVLLFAVLMVFVVGSQGTIGEISGRSWLCYYYAIQNGHLSVVVPIDKMSILVTILFSRIFLKEKLSAKAAAGLAMMCAGALAMTLWA